MAMTENKLYGINIVDLIEIKWFQLFIFAQFPFVVLLSLFFLSIKSVRVSMG